jgi:primosomal protein N'
MTTASSLQARHYTRTAQLANAMGGSARIRDALTYLDHADWDLGGAMQQYQFDLEDRQTAATAPPLARGTDPNRNLDRRRASGGPNWDKKKLKLSIHVGDRWKDRDYTTVDRSFNIEDPSPIEILRLNRWRHRSIMDYAGLRHPPFDGEWWHPAEYRDLRQRYLDNYRKDPASPAPANAAQSHNQLFQGVQLPGETGEASVRRGPQVNSFWVRDHKKNLGRMNKHKNKKKDEKLRGAKDQHRKMVEVIKWVQKEDKKKSKASLEQDFSSTMEMLDALDQEPLLIETDGEWESTGEEEDDEEESSSEDSEHEI